MSESLSLGEATLAKWLLENSTPKTPYFVDLILGHVAILNRMGVSVDYEGIIRHFTSIWPSQALGTALNICIQKGIIMEVKAAGEERFELKVDTQNSHLLGVFPALAESSDPLAFLGRRIALFHGWPVPDFDQQEAPAHR